MINIVKKTECNGCHACTNICPKDCISMEIDSEGFWYPKVDLNKCIDCSLCEKVCPIINAPEREKYEVKGYACKSNSEGIRKDSSSGGIFTLLIEDIIYQNGVVFGASFDKNLNLRHTYAETLEECSQFRGSKYVQSKIGDTYTTAKKFLNEGRMVLFSGTQCQIKGLNLFLRKEYKNLITCEIVCHGVPSPKVFRFYKDNLIKKYKSNIKEVKFRDKTLGWNKFSFVAKFENGEVYSKPLNEDIYMKGFLTDLYLRPSCYECTSKNYTSNSDLTLADYWGVENIHSEFKDDKGTSLVIVNTIKGENIFKKIKNNMDILETDLDYATSYNPCIVRPVHYNEKREGFFKEVNEENIENIIYKYTKVQFIEKAKNRVRSVLGKIKRNLFN